ncbi:hypothetical protein QOZ80_3AG0227670 [Eleusine coracana subsp. coracana]|nr:hypothetical protein QOZ80_3AG0227670 [Eleusine coracana subsp. coracana]
MTRAMGRRLHISVEEGKPRPHEPTQAAKFVSEADVIIRDQLKSKKPAQLLEDGQEGVDEETKHEWEVNAVEVFKVRHTSNKKGISEVAREAVSSMETTLAETAADGEAPLHTVEVVSKVLSQSSSTNTFLKNAGISANHIETEAEWLLRERLEAEKEGAAALLREVDALKKKSEDADAKLEKVKQEFEQFKNYQEENNALLRQTLLLNGVGNSSQPTPADP